MHKCNMSMGKGTMTHTCTVVWKYFVGKNFCEQ